MLISLLEKQKYQVILCFMHVSRKDEVTEDQIERSVGRASVVVVIFILFATIILARSFYIQIIKGSYYKNEGNSQYTTKTPINFDRGNIYFSNYKKEPSPSAEINSTYKIAIDPTQISKKEESYIQLSDFLTIDKDFFMEKVNKENDPYEEIAKDISKETVDKIKGLNVKGVSFVRDNKRSYPNNEIGAKLIGFVGSSGLFYKGQYGVEKYYNDVLSREDGNFSVNFFAEIFADIKNNSVSNLKRDEGDIILTVDSNVERFLYETLKETKDTWGSEIVGGIVMDPKTGAIIAMEGLPSFNPNKYGETKDQSHFINQNISGVYELGSIIKPLTVAAAIDSGAIDEKTTTYNDTGFRELNGYKVSNYDGKPRGPNTSMQMILDKSLNMGIVFLVEKMGSKNFQEYFKNFGLGEETGIDLPIEASGLTDNLDSDVFVDNATAGFGQGIAITPIQTIRALALLANGGKLVTPHVVESIIYQNGEVKKTDAPFETSQVLKKDTSERVSRMLVHVVDNALKDGSYKMPNYSVAAKTGTAQMVKSGGGYYDDRYLHSFFGYFPAYDPKYIIFLFHTNPKGAEYASATLTDPFFKLVKFLISYYEIPPDR